MADAVLQRAVIGEQQQAFAVQIQTSGGADIGLRQIIGQGGAAFRVGELRQDTVGLIEQNDFCHLNLELGNS